MLPRPAPNQPQLEFIQHDVLTIPFPVDDAGFHFLPILADASSVTACCSRILGPSGHRRATLLAIHETEALHSTHPALSRYYEMVAQMQKHYGQELNAGALLD